MAKGSTKKRTSARDNFISEQSIDTYVANNYIKEKKRIISLENATGKNVCEVLQELGSLNMQLKDIAVLIGIPQKKLKEMMEKGERDFEEDLYSEERQMYVAYKYGIKSLEATAVLSLMNKHPDKLLEAVNPEVYSDKIADKYEMPTININISDKKEVNLEEIRKRVMIENEQTVKEMGE
jgi:hypothetical protein